MFPPASTFTSLGVNRPLAEARGKVPLLISVEPKSDWPKTAVGVPDPEGNSRTRLSPGIETYKVPAASTARPAGPARLELEIWPGLVPVVKLGCPHTLLAEGSKVASNGAGNFKTRALLKSDTYRLSRASKASATGRLNEEPETVRPRLAVLLVKSGWPITKSASGGAGLLSTPARKRSTRWFPVSATYRLPLAGSTANPRGLFKPLAPMPRGFEYCGPGCPRISVGRSPIW